MMMKSSNIVLAYLLLLGGTSCGKRETVKPEQTQTQVSSGRGSSSPKTTATGRVPAGESSAPSDLEPGSNTSHDAFVRDSGRYFEATSEAHGIGRQLALKNGLNSLSEIVSRFTGENRRAAIGAAVPTLLETHDRVTVLNAVNDLPPGGDKIQAIRNIFNERHGPVIADDRMLSAIRSLEYKEDRAEAVMYLLPLVELTNSTDLFKMLSFVEEEGVSQKELVEPHKGELVERYIHLLTRNERWLDPANIKDIPVEYHQRAIKQAVTAAVSGNEGSLVPLVNWLNHFDPALQSTGIEIVFNKAAEISPENAVTQLAALTPETRGAGISGILSKWMASDSRSASGWASTLNESDQAVAARVIVDYLERKQGSREDITPWRLILKQQKSR